MLPKPIQGWTLTTLREKLVKIGAKVEWHAGELFPRVGFLVTNLKWRCKRLVRFYNARGTADITHPHYTSSERWCGDPDPGYNPCVGVA